MSRRIEWIDALKGFAILVVVIGHCVADSLHSNTFPIYQQYMQMFFDFIYSFHMPFFFTISGFVFCLSTKHKNIWNKVLDFTLLYLIWSTLMWISKFIMAKDVNNPVTLFDLLSIIYKPIMVYWYIYVLILMYIAVTLLNIKSVNSMMLLLSAIISVLSKLCNFEIGVVGQFLYHMYFFLAGGYCACTRFVKKIDKRFFLISLVMLGLVGANNGIYKIMYLCAPESVIDWKLGTGSRYTEAGMAAVYYYFGAFGVILFAAIMGFIVAATVNCFLRFIANNNLIAAMLMLRIFMIERTFLSMFTMADFFKPLSLLSYIYLYFAWNRVPIIKFRDGIRILLKRC